MPERGDVPDLLSKCVSLERDSPERAEKAERLKSGVQNGATNLLELVVLMEKYLTSNDDSVRARGVALLAEIVSAGVKLSSSEQQHLADFFTSRFADWASLNGALAGCQALLDGEPDEEIVRLVAESLTMELHIQQHKQADRQLALKLLLKLISDWGSTLVLSAHMSVLDATIAAVDGEKDPRCLMLAFECVAAVAKLYSLPGMDPDILQSGAEDLFDVVSCYFPISFTPAPDDKHGLSRSHLVTALHTTLAVTPLFAPFCIPLLLEKLSSTLRQAKADALDCLGLCLESYGRSAMADSLSAVWSALRRELMPSFVGNDWEDTGEELQGEALSCLTRGVQSLGQDVARSDSHEGLEDIILSDACVQDLLAILDMSREFPLPDGAVENVKRITKVLAAVCAGTPFSCSKVFMIVFIPVVQAVGQWARHQRERSSVATGKEQAALVRLQLWVLCQLLHAARVACQMRDWQECCVCTVAADLKRIVEVLSHLPSLSGVAEEDGVPCMAELCMAVSLELLCFPGHLKVVSVEDRGQHLVQLMEPLFAGRPLPDGEDQNLQELQDFSIQGLQELCKAKREREVSEQVVPRLVNRVSGAASIEEGRCLLRALGGLASESEMVAKKQLELLKGVVLSVLSGLRSMGQQDICIAIMDYFSCDLVWEQGALWGAPEWQQGFTEVVSKMVAVMEEATAANQALDCKMIDACCRSASRLAALCDEQHQLGIFSTSFSSIGNLRISNDPAALGSASAAGQLPVCLCCISALRPGLIQQTEGLAILREVCNIVTCEEISETLLHTASVTAGSIANKIRLEGGRSGQWEDAVSPIVRESVFPCLAEEGPQAYSSFYFLGWFLKGAVMSGQGQGLVSECIELVIQRLEGLTQSMVCPSDGDEVTDAMDVDCAQPSDLKVARCASLVFETVLAAGEAARNLCFLDANAHIVSKVLWQQRFFSTSCRQLVACLERGKVGWDSGSHLCVLALAHLMKGAPTACIHVQASTTLPWLLIALHHLQRPGLSDPQLLHRCLLLLSEFLLEPRLQQHCEASLQRVVDVLMELCQWRHSARVREVALQCVTALMALPYSLLHPHKLKVAKALAKCLDDNKRSVRQVAAKCREAWLKQ